MRYRVSSDAREELNKVRQSGTQILMASHYLDSTKTPDVRKGQHRFPNMTLAPFSGSEPIRMVPVPDVDRPDKVLAVWLVEHVSL